MDRRALLKGLGGAAMAAPMLAAGDAMACEASAMIDARKAGVPAKAAANGPTAAILLYPGFSAVDVAAARQMLESRGASSVALLSAGPPTAAVRSDIGLAIQPDAAMDVKAQAADLLFVPGGAGARQAVARADVIAFLSSHGRQARKVAATGEAALLIRKAGIAGARIARDGEGGSAATGLFA